MNTWHMFFTGMADFTSIKSKDRSTKVGAVIVGEDNEVLSIGYNGFPRGVDDTIDERHNRPDKYEFTEHAERNAIYNAARQGIRLKDSTMYLNWEPIPCPDCTRAIIQAGIKRVVGPNIEFPNNSTMDWHERFKHSISMLEEAGIEIVTIEENEIEQ